LFLAMPARRLTDHCPRCHEKNHLRARYCSGCGCRLGEDRHLRAAFGERSKLHADIAHPINADTRRELERQVLAAYEVELAKSALPGYVAPSLDGEDVEPYDSPYALGSSAEPSRFRPMGTAG
jgi:stage V sporulation protein G